MEQVNKLEIENFDKDELMKNVIKNVYRKLNFQNISDFQKYLETFDFSLADVEKKLKIEVMWNQLIAEKFKSQITIDKNKIRDYLTTPKIKIVDGMIEIPEEPGFGVDVDERFLNDFTYNENITVNKVLE